MKRFVAFILILGWCLFFVEKGCTQSKAKTVEWINTHGEEIIKEITGNSSIYWDLDQYGSFRITNYNPETLQSESKKIVKQYTYLNFFELDPKLPLEKRKLDNSKAEFLFLKCKKGKDDCIKVRNYFSKTNFKTSTTSTYLFKLKGNKNFDHINKLKYELLKCIKSFETSTE